MKDIIKYNYIDGWYDLGGGLSMYFTLSSAYSRYGCWGLTEDYTKPDRNFKMQGAREVLKELEESTNIEIAKNNIISPNPADEYFSFSNDSYIGKKYIIYDVKGKEVDEGITKNINSLKNLKSEIYFIKVFQNGATAVKKVVKY